MSDLTDFLLARIAEDEAVAREATRGPWVWSARFNFGDETTGAVMAPGRPGWANDEMAVLDYRWEWRP